MSRKITKFDNWMKYNEIAYLACKTFGTIYDYVANCHYDVLFVS